MLISFAWTIEPFLANRKNVTRRYWKDSHAKKFKKGMIIDAFDKLPYRGGKKIGEIKLTKDPYQQRTSEMKTHDFIQEGLYWMFENNKTIHGKDVETFFSDWIKKDDLVWVIEFEKINTNISNRK